MSRTICAALVTLLFAATTRADDWPMLGRDRSHNAVSSEKGAPTDWQVEIRGKSGAVELPARNIAWTAKLGSRSLGGPIIANGLVWVGTNNSNPRDPRHVDPKRLHPVTKRPYPLDLAVLMCFRERDGQFLWQYTSSRLPMPHDYSVSCIGSAPLVEGDRLWFQTNRWEVVCLDIGPLQRGDGVPKVLWRVDLIKEFGVFPHAPMMAAGLAPAVAADAERLYVVTGNGIDVNHQKVPALEAPSLVCLDKKTGKAVWKDNSPGKDIMRTQLSSPLVIEAKGRAQVVVGQGDGWLRSFDAKSGKPLWKCDLNAKGAKYMFGGGGTRNYPMATPVFSGGRVYIATGRDPEFYGGAGDLYCVDPTKEGDVSQELDDGTGKGKPNPNSAVVWHRGGKEVADADREYQFGRTLSNCTVHDGLLYISEIDGYVHCLDAANGKPYWLHDLRSEVWGSALWVDGKVYVSTSDGDVFVFAHGKEKKVLAKVAIDTPSWTTPVFANGTLYLLVDDKLFAVRSAKMK